MNSIRIISRLSAVLVVLAVAILLAASGLARAVPDPADAYADTWRRPPSQIQYRTFVVGATGWNGATSALSEAGQPPPPLDGSPISLAVLIAASLAPSEGVAHSQWPRL